MTFFVCAGERTFVGRTCGLKVGEDSGFGFGGLCWCKRLRLRCGFCRRKIFCRVKESADDTGARFFHFDFGCKRAVGGIEGDLFDGFDFGCGSAARLGFG